VSDKTAALQDWLNAMGWTPRLLVDGSAGPRTREAFYGLFANRNAPAVTIGQIEAFAARLGGTVKQLRAVAAVESSGGGFLPSGHPKILWERHYFFKRLKLKIPLLSDPAPGGYTQDADKDGINDSWEKLVDGAMRNPFSAIESASWGKFQVMGAWWEKLGYHGALSFAWSMRESEAGHYEAMVRYIEVFGGKALFQRIDGSPANCRAFAEFYNGPKQRGYDTRIAAEMRKMGG
jgi:hypothetical protein